MKKRSSELYYNGFIKDVEDYKNNIVKKDVNNYFSPLSINIYSNEDDDKIYKIKLLDLPSINIIIDTKEKEGEYIFNWCDDFFR